MGAASQTWAQIRSTVRGLEAQTNSEFNTFAQYASSSRLPLEPSEGEIASKARLEKLVSQRKIALSQLENSLNGEEAAKSSDLKRGHLAIHQSRLDDDIEHIAKLRAQIDSQRKKAAHLESIHSGLGGPMDETTRQYYQERTAIDRSSDMVSRLMAQASEARQSLLFQDETLSNINRRVSHAASHIPGVNTLMSRISARKRRDGVILGTFMAVCFLFFFYIT